MTWCPVFPEQPHGQRTRLPDAVAIVLIQPQSDEEPIVWAAPQALAGAGGAVEKPLPLYGQDPGARHATASVSTSEPSGDRTS